MSKIAYLAVPLGYATFNVALMLAFANGLLGPVPFDAIWLFVALSVLGEFAALLLPVFDVAWSHSLAVAGLFGTLVLFNLWCLFAASAAV